MGKIIEAACEYGVRIANDNSHGYDQINRWLPDVDCSSFVTLCYENAGVPVKSKGGATYTGNLKEGFTKCGFTAIKCKPVMPGLKRGDVLFYNYVKNGKTHGHAVLYIGGGQIVQASINEKGTAIGGKTGDQTGKEVSVGNYYNPSYGWDYILRYEKEDQENKLVNVEMPELRQGDIRPEVGTMQIILNARGFGPLKVDNDFGKNTAKALGRFQKSHGLTPDEICGVKSWPLLLRSDY
jgi:hypothetical protein